MKNVKLNLKNWNRVRKKPDDDIKKFEEDFNDALLAVDEDPTDVDKFHSMVAANHNLKNVLYSKYEDLKQ